MKRFARIRAQKGVALVSVIWLLLLLSIAAASFAMAMRLDTVATFRDVDAARARQWARGAAERGIYDLMAEPGSQTIRRDGTPFYLQADGIAMTVTIQDQSGLVDLNAAPAPILNGLFRALDFSQTQADVMAQGIMDWRDKDDRPRRNGAEAADYAAANTGIRPRNGPFISPSDLGTVLALSKLDLAKIRPNVTAHSFGLRINPQTAPLPVLLAVPGITPAQADEVMRRRAAGLPSLRPPAAAAWLGTRYGPIYRVRGTARLPSGTESSVELLVWPSGRDGEAPGTLHILEFHNFS